jgi:hypothetical protein
VRNEGGREDVYCLEYAWDRGDGFPFAFSFCHHLVLHLFPFPRTPAQLLGNDLLIKGCAANMTLAFITHQYNGAANVLHPFQVHKEDLSENYPFLNSWAHLPAA